MAFTKIEISHIESAMAELLEKRRPPQEFRAHRDLAFRIDGLSVILMDLHPLWRDSSQRVEEPFAKATYLRKANLWQIHWQRADHKWQAYAPQPEVLYFEDFLELLDEDVHACFWG